MTHDEIVELIQQVVREEKRSVGFFQRLRETTALVMPIVALLGVLNFAFLKASVEPAIDMKLEQHQVDAREKMKEVGDRYVLKTNFDVYVSGSMERWRQQDLTNARIEAALVEIQRDIKELLRRK